MKHIAAHKYYIKSVCLNSEMCALKCELSLKNKIKINPPTPLKKRKKTKNPTTNNNNNTHKTLT